MDNAAQFGENGAQFSGDAVILKATPRISLEAVQSKARTGFAEQFLVVSILILSTTAFVNLFPGELGVEYEEEGKLFAQILWSLLYLLILVFVRKRVKELFHQLCDNKLLILLLGW